MVYEVRKTTAGLSIPVKKEEAKVGTTIEDIKYYDFIELKNVLSDISGSFLHLQTHKKIILVLVEVEVFAYNAKTIVKNGKGEESRLNGDAEGLMNEEDDIDMEFEEVK